MLTDPPEHLLCATDKFTFGVSFYFCSDPHIEVTGPKTMGQ